MDLKRAERIAIELFDKMAPFCVRAEIAGSIRRRKPDVKDIEIVVVPKWENDLSNLFGESDQQVNKLLEWASYAELSGVVRWIKPGTSEIIPWQPKGDGKYWRGVVDSVIKLDLFLATPENFGLILAIRTGDAEFSRGLVTRAKAIGCPSVDGYLTREGGKRLILPYESDVFASLRIDWVHPKDRHGFAAVVPWKTPV